MGADSTTTCAYWAGQVEATFYGNLNYCIPRETSPEPEEPDTETKITAATTVLAPVPVASTVKYAVPKTTYFINPHLASSDVGYVPGKSNENQQKGVKSAEGTTALHPNAQL